MKHTSEADSFDEYRRRMEAEGYHIAMQPIQLTPGRYPLPKPYPETWSIDRQIVEAVREGNKAIDEDEQKSSKPNSVKSDPKTAMEDSLAAKSNNPYVRARGEILGKMTPKARSVIEEMEKGTIKKDARYDKFCLQVSELGDKLSSSNN